MALTMSSIAQTEEINNQVLRTETNSLQKLEGFFNQLKINTEFEKFRNGTPAGERLFEQILQLFEARAKIADVNRGLCNTVKVFLDNQRFINK